MNVVRSQSAPGPEDAPAGAPRTVVTGSYPAGTAAPEAPEQVACVLVPAETPSVSRCRRFLLACAQRWRLRRGVDDAALALSELVSNAVEHAGGPIAVTVSRADGELHLDVTAPATPGVPRVLAPAGTTASGRGLRIVEAVARTWGWRDSGPRRTVWAVLKVWPGEHAGA